MKDQILFMQEKFADPARLSNDVSTGTQEESMFGQPYDNSPTTRHQIVRKPREMA